MSIAHRHLDIAMPHHRRDVAENRSAQGKPGAEGMPQGMEKILWREPSMTSFRPFGVAPLTNYAEK